MYISAFGDPPITDVESEFFRRFLGYLKHYDDDNRILRFSMRHADTSRFVHATVSGLVQEFALCQLLSAPRMEPADSLPGVPKGLSGDTTNIP